MIWWVIAIAAAAILWKYRREGPNAVWGTATLGLLVGLTVASYQPGFDWRTIGKAVAIGAIIGLVLELLPRLTRLWSK